jgi:hypothetical protein
MRPIDERIAAVKAMLDCTHPKTNLVWNFSRGGHRQLRSQCAICGAMAGPVNKASEAPPNTQQADAAAFAASESRWRLRHSLHAEKETQDREDWWDWYNFYLTSDQWQEKRRRVLERAAGVCEGCGERKATQVHHTTYAHAGDEFLFELRAICTECHERLHERATT